MSCSAKVAVHKLIFTGSVMTTLMAILAVFTGTAVAAENLHSAHLLAPNAGWILADNHLLWTSSAGSDWSDITPAPTDRKIFAAFFSDISNGWILRSGANTGTLELARTDDGGGNWSTSDFPISREDAASFSGKAWVDFVDAANGWVMLRRISSSNFSFGTLFATSDGGASWTKLPTPPIGDAIRFTTATHGRLAGGPDGQRLFLTKDGGHTWTAATLSPAAQKPGAAVSEFDSQVVSVTASEGTLTTELEGRVAGTATKSIAADAAAVEAHFINANQGWVLVARGFCNGVKIDCHQEQTLLATTNGGASFTNITPALAATITTTAIDTIQTGNGGGFDQCAVGSVSAMQAWFSHSPYHFSNAYIGGANRACSQALLNSSWVKSIVAQGWRLFPLWVGLQAPGSSCGGCSAFSTNTATASSQGVAEADAAAAAAAALGLTNTVIYYDLEQYDFSNSTFNAAVKAFVSAWVNRLHEYGNVAAIYSNPGPFENAILLEPALPDDIFVADENFQPTNFVVSGFTNHRLHQYNLNITQTFGGVTFNIDQDFLNGDVTPSTPVAPVHLGDQVTCHIFDDGFINMAGPSNAIFINSSGQACIPNGTAAGVCRRWFGRCSTTTTPASSKFFVFDNGNTNVAGPSDAVFINQNNQACIPGGATGVCRRWFGLGVTSDNRKVQCSVFGNGFSAQSGFFNAIFVDSVHFSCVPNGQADGYCARWFGLCGAQ